MSRCFNYTWSAPTPQKFSIAPAARVMLAPAGTFVTFAILTAEMTNATHVSIGSSQVTTTAGVTNAAVMQLMAGSVGVIWVDDFHRESFDLGRYFATNGHAVSTILLFVSIYAANPQGLP